MNKFPVTDSEEYDSDDEDEAATPSQAAAKKPKPRTALTKSDSEASEEGESTGEPCAICLGRMRGNIGSPEGCDHSFCLDCILEWARVSINERLFSLNLLLFHCFVWPDGACLCFKITLAGIKLSHVLHLQAC